MLERLESIEKRYEEMNQLMAQPEVAAEFERLQSLAKEQAGISELVAKYREYKKTSQSLEETRTMLDEGLEGEMTALVKEELESLKACLENLTRELQKSLMPRDANDEKDVIVEIRAGAGGEEAALFAAALFRMYTRYAEAKGWQVDVIDSNQSGIGGFKEIIFEIKGKGAYSRLKYERGVHRVQRVPVTESSGRIHTSTATVAVLPESEEVEVEINPDELKVDIFRSGGRGGQNVNKVSTAVRITHLPTGIVAICQDERSQLRNRMRAMAVLRARLLDREQRRQFEEVAKERRSQVGSGERSEKIRTYNFPQGRVSDHRIGLTLHNLESILEGELDTLIDALAMNDQMKQLEGE
ncbi:MAG: peptide chain release factor 1 [Dehalococcoidia bacterium]|nr:peptide chain release factor 1 [Dehalococcoidia bacterium]